MDAFKERQSSNQACRAATEVELKAVTNSIGSLFLQRDVAMQMGALDTVDGRIQSLKTRKDELELLLANMGESYEEIVEQTLRCFELQKLALEAVKYGSTPARQVILKSLASNYFVKSKTLLPEWRTPFLEKSQNDGCTTWLPHQLSARTLLDACTSVECRIIYVGNFRPWKEEVELRSSAN